MDDRAWRFWRRGQEGSLSLEQSLVIALLVLVASATLLLMGKAVACVFQKEAGSVSGQGFWAAAPVVTPGTSGMSDGSVSWDSAGVAGPYRVLRYRSGDAGNPQDPSTWTLLDTVDASPASGLDIVDGDSVAVAADADRCGFALMSPAWPSNGGSGEPPAPQNATPGWYAGWFGVGDDATAAYDQVPSEGNYTDYLAAFDSDGNQLWAKQPTIGGQPAVLEWGRISVSGTSLYAGMYTGAYENEGVYRIPGWRSATAAGVGDPQLVCPMRVDGLGTTFSLSPSSIKVSPDGQYLLAVGQDNGGAHDLKLLLVRLSDLAVADMDVPNMLWRSDTMGVFGADGHAYALDSEGVLWRLANAGPTQVGQLPGWAVYSYTLESVGADGTAYFYDWYSGNSDSLSMTTDGNSTVVQLPAVACENSKFAGALTPTGQPVIMEGDWNSAVNSLRLLTATAGTHLKSPLFTEPVASPRPYAMGWSLATVMGGGHGGIYIPGLPAGSSDGSLAGDGSTNQLDLSNPQGVAVSSAGYVYVSDTNNDRVVAFDSDGHYLRQFGTTGAGALSSPQGIAVDYDGDVLVADSGHDRLVKYSPTGAYVGELVTGLNGPFGVAVAPGGNIYVSESNTSNVHEYDPNGDPVRDLDFTGGPLPVGLRHVAVGLDGLVYVAARDVASSGVAKFDAYGNYLLGFDSGNQAKGLAVGNDLSVWVANFGSGLISHHAADGTHLADLGLAQPNGIAAINGGGLYAVTGTGSLVKYSNANAVLWSVSR